MYQASGQSIALLRIKVMSHGNTFDVYIKRCSAEGGI